ncbi:hypothetical protein RvY_17517 [Ramazzottius varieornatus]|uniref:Uncharacterized protein n=1 Tax=Ramazzottius varieornatus TaxID=947166 RepID=A0A1D1W678_RAMVA|nr:hypothetical protein RvY_17517 [Ramazzottius varieornatus]
MITAPQVTAKFNLNPAAQRLWNNSMMTAVPLANRKDQAANGALQLPISDVSWMTNILALKDD